MNSIIAYYNDSNLLSGKLIEGMFHEEELENVVEIDDVKLFIDSDEYIKGIPFEKLTLEECKDISSERKENLVFVYKDHAWFHGIFREDTEESKLKTFLDFENPLANFHGWKISKLSKFKRSKNPDIFDKSMSLSDSVFQEIKISSLIKTSGLWNKSLDNILLQKVCKDFNVKSPELASANYFKIYFWDNENLIFISFDPEEPARESNFDSRDTLVIDKRFIIEFYKPFKHNKDWDLLESTISSNYFDTMNIGEPHDPAFYTITCLNNFIDYLNESNYTPKLYIHDC